MSPQDQVERVLKDIHVYFAQCERSEDNEDVVKVNLKEFMDLLERLNYAIYELMESYEMTQQTAGNTERAARREGDRIIEESQKKADDVYAASLLFTNESINGIRDIMDDMHDSMNDLMRKFKKDLYGQRQQLQTNETELRSQLADLADTRTYLQVLENINHEHELKRRNLEEEREAGRAFARSLTGARDSDQEDVNQLNFDRASYGVMDFDQPFDEAPSTSQGQDDSSGMVFEKPDIKINRDAAYFKWKERQMKEAEAETQARAEEKERRHKKELKAAKEAKEKARNLETTGVLHPETKSEEQAYRADASPQPEQDLDKTRSIYIPDDELNGGQQSHSGDTIRMSPVSRAREDWKDEDVSGATRILPVTELKEAVAAKVRDMKATDDVTETMDASAASNRVQIQQDQSGALDDVKQIHVSETSGRDSTKTIYVPDDAPEAEAEAVQEPETRRDAAALKTEPKMPSFDTDPNRPLSDVVEAGEELPNEEELLQAVLRDEMTHYSGSASGKGDNEFSEAAPQMRQPVESSNYREESDTEESTADVQGQTASERGEHSEERHAGRESLGGKFKDFLLGRDFSDDEEE